MVGKIVEKIQNLCKIMCQSEKPVGVIVVLILLLDAYKTIEKLNSNDYDLELLKNYLTILRRFVF